MGALWGARAVSSVPQLTWRGIEWGIIFSTCDTSGCSCSAAFSAGVLRTAGFPSRLLHPRTLLSFGALTPLLLHLFFFLSGPLCLHKQQVANRLLETGGAVTP